MNPIMLQYFFNDIEKQKDIECNYIRNLMYTLIADTVESVKKRDVKTSCVVDPSKLHFLKHTGFYNCNEHYKFEKNLQDLGLRLHVFPMVSLEKGRIEFDVLERKLTYFQKFQKRNF